MSTRSQTKIIYGKKSIILYHHSDGYIEGLGFFLGKLMERARNNKYLEVGQTVSNLIKKTRYEITFANHCDIEFYYELDFNKMEVRAWEVNNWNKKMEKLVEFNIDEELQKSRTREDSNGDIEMYIDELNEIIGG